MDGTAGVEEDGSGTTLQRLVRRAIRDWTRQLVDVSGRNTLLSFRPLKAGTLDLARASEEASQALLFGEKVRISDAFGEEAADATFHKLKHVPPNAPFWAQVLRWFEPLFEFEPPRSGFMPRLAECTPFRCRRQARGLRFRVWAGLDFRK